ncbi:MAG: threonylcarbamoyl-AMP synthase [Thermoplasmata archaeon]|nr:MAG: threonylcarbamoyl-AMP synthase [Thermoplasmata archaeon]
MTHTQNKGKEGALVRDLLRNDLTEEDLTLIKDLMAQKKLLVYPTETLYALGCDPFSIKAIKHLIEVKGRPKTMPISIAVSDMSMMESVAYVNDFAQWIFEELLPGPITILLKKKEHVPQELTGGSEKIGIRVPANPVAQKIIDYIGPMTATSANIHGHPEPGNVMTAINQLGNAVALYLDGGECVHKKPSTVVDITGKSAKIIRGGVLSEQEITKVLEKAL